MTATLKPIPKKCNYCNREFIARKYATRFCSKQCGSKAAKAKARSERYERHMSDQEGNEKDERLSNCSSVADSNNVSLNDRDLIDIKMLSKLSTISERTLFRLIKTPGFPKLKIGRTLRFHRATTISFINEKFADHERDIEKKEDCERRKR